jgi:hypothetical protein
MELPVPYIVKFFSRWTSSCCTRIQVHEGSTNYRALQCATPPHLSVTSFLSVQRPVLLKRLYVRP